MACNHYVQKMQWDRYMVFKEQDHEKGDFDVKFDIGGRKIIYANKFILKPISETLNSWLTDRWIKKDEAVKIDTYSYHNFYQFLCFIYIGTCGLTNDNIKEMVDIAEFFGVTYLKELCDKYLSRIDDISVENAEKMFEFADKYSLPLFIESIKHYIFNFADTIFRDDNFLSFKKHFVAFIFDALNGNFIEEFFEAAYKWVEHQITEEEKAADTNIENANFEEVINAELRSIIPHPEFAEMRFEFLMDFVVEKGFILSPMEFYQIFLPYPTNGYEDEAAFNHVYKLAEKQALKKQMTAVKNGESFNQGKCINADLAKISPLLKFRDRSKEFLMDFVGEKGLTLSAGDLAKICQFGFQIGNEEKRFKFVCELAEKQALQKQKMSSDPNNFNIAQTIKSDLAEVIPCAELYTVDKQFLHDFVVANGIISEEDAKRVYHTRIEIQNGDQVIAGEFMDDYGIRQKLGNSFSHGTKHASAKKFRFNKLKSSIPSIPSTVMKMKGILWYLCFEKDGIFTIKHHSIIDRSDYLIAELGNNDEFRFDPNNLTRFTFLSNL